MGANERLFRTRSGFQITVFPKLKKQDWSISDFLTSGHVTQKWGQRSKNSIAIAPLSSKRWIRNRIGWYQTADSTIAANRIFRFPVHRLKNRTKSKKIYTVLISLLSNLRIPNSIEWYWTDVCTIPRFEISRFPVMWLEPKKSFCPIRGISYSNVSMA